MEWRDVPSIPGVQVSEDGTIRSSLTRWGSGYPWKIIKGSINRHRGRRYVSIADVNRSYSRVVAEAWHPNPENKREVNHIDGDKLNNHPSNLEWVTPSENMLHAYRTGLKKVQRGSDNPKAKLTETDVAKIRGYPASGRTLGFVFGIRSDYAITIRNGTTKNWEEHKLTEKE